MSTFDPEQFAAVSNFSAMAAACFATAYKTALALDLPEDVAEHFASQLLDYFMTPSQPTPPDLSALMERMTKGGTA